jgi:hypothetical protein
MIEDEKLDRSRIFLNDTDFDRVSKILETPPKLSPEAADRLRRKPVWELDDTN